MLPAADSLDPRTTLARPDLADQALEGIVRAGRYRATRPMHGRRAVADIRADADAASARLDQLLFGEAFDVLDRRGGFAWGRARRDGMVGWVPETDLAAGAPRPSHRMAAVDADLPLNALCASRPGAAPIGEFERDPAAVAERLIGVPHQPGARSSLATDCSGLVQQALLACGLPGPRNADEQARLGRAVSRGDARRNDIVVWIHSGPEPWSGHSALMLDDRRLIHASGDKGSVVIEDFEDADARCRADGYDAPVFRRL